MEGNGNEQSPKQPGLLQDRASQIPCDPFPPFYERVCVCKSGAAHKAEQPHLWRVIKPQSGEREGEKRQRSKKVSVSVRPLPVINRPSLPCGALTTWTTGAVSSDSDATNAPSRTLTEPHSKEPHSMLIRAFARARNRETGARNCDTLHNEI